MATEYPPSCQWGGLLGKFARALTSPWVQAADIKALHRSHVWGPRSEQFDPARHQPERLTTAQKRAYLPSGHDPLQCVAHKWAPRVVGLIVTGILDGKRTITTGKGIGEREGCSITRMKARV